MVRYSDVLLITDTQPPFTEEVTNAAGDVTKPASGMVVGLRQAGIPVSVIKWMGDWSLVAAVACGTGPDTVIAAGFDAVQGLERHIVVYAESSGPDTWGRLHCMSRCTSRLLWVKRP
jgi:hypothetical protein